MINENSVSLCMVVYNDSARVENLVLHMRKHLVDEVVIIDQSSSYEHSEKLKEIDVDLLRLLFIERSKIMYYDIKKCYIGFHGDTERKIVMAVRLGATIPIHYRWYQEGKPIEGKEWSININDGDMYIMSDKAVGTDWKRRKIKTLRHAAGFSNLV